MKQILLSLLLPLAVHAEARYHFGDDPRWAEPQFDDSPWPTASPEKFPMPAVESDGMVWLRFRVPVPAGDGPLAVYLARDNGACAPGELWVNGVRVGIQGRFPPQPLTLKRCVTNVFPLPAGTVQPGMTAVVAWRSWLAPVFTSGFDYTPPVPFEPRIAPREFLQWRENESRALERLKFQWDLFLNVLQLMLASGLLALWFRTQTPVLLWFALFTLAWSASGFLSYWWFTVVPGYSHFAFWSSLWGSWLIFLIALVEFMKQALAPPRWVTRTLGALSVVWTLLSFAPALGAEPPPYDLKVALYLAIAVGAALCGGVMAVSGWFIWRGQPQTRGLAITLFLAGLTYLIVVNAGIVIQAFEVSLENLATTLLIAAICYLLLSRLWSDWRKREDLNAEFEAAREMQQALVQRLPETPGFVVEAAYQPASQVGGDFYRIFPAEDGSILVVVGDVSGKGLKAAMTVSVLVGAMESLETREPGLFLAKLNRAIQAELASGFVTCCAALIRRDGAAVIANAGHLAPCLDGQEAAVEPGLPLGLVPDLTYAETIARAEWFTFVSDGVVEAENAQRELFGFDRTREMSMKPAREIAEVAREWGQNDDITVVTVRRSSA